MPESLAFKALAEAAVAFGYEGDQVALGGDDELITLLLLPDQAEQVGCHFTYDLFTAPERSRSIAERVVQQMAQEAALKIADLSPEDVVLDQLTELVPFLRHSPGCPVAEDHGADSRECVCSLSPTIGSLMDEQRITVVRCCGCGVHAIDPDGAEDWAWQERDGLKYPYCHSCAVALGA